MAKLETGFTRIALYIRFVVEFEIGLKIHHPRARKQSRIQPVRLGLDRRGITHPLEICLTHAIERHAFLNFLTNSR
jgi:hypothetical protein